MADHPIIFSAAMIGALLAGRKTQTRRLAWRFKTLPAVKEDGMLRNMSDHWECLSSNGDGIETWRAETLWQSVKPGDRLWCREVWAHDAEDLETCRRAFEDILPGGNTFGPYYRAGEVAPETLKWRSPIHMPRWASRLTLVVTATKIERLRDISETDAIAEGIDRHNHSAKWPDGSPGVIGNVARRNFATLWENLHGAGSWRSDPEVVVLTFAAHKQNIDAMKEAA